MVAVICSVPICMATKRAVRKIIYPSDCRNGMSPPGTLSYLLQATHPHFSKTLALCMITSIEHAHICWKSCLHLCIVEGRILVPADAKESGIHGCVKEVLPQTAQILQRCGHRSSRCFEGHMHERLLRFLVDKYLEARLLMRHQWIPEKQYAHNSWFC